MRWQSLINSHRQSRWLSFELGRKVGPRFAVVGENSLLETVAIPAAHETRGEVLSQTSVTRLRRAPGLPRDHHTVLRRQNRRLRVMTLTLVVVGAVIGFVLWSMQRNEGKHIRALKELNEKFAQRLEETKRDVSLQRDAWQEQKGRLEHERTTLLTQLNKLERNSITSSRERESLQEQLAQTGAKLELLKPISLEQLEEQRREVLERTLRAIVYIEKKVFYRDRKSSELLFIEDMAPGVTGANFEGRGKPFHEETGGSGFCVSQDGWIITNAHVVRPPESEVLTVEDREIVQEMQLAVVFSGTEERRAARVHRATEDDENDVALLKIESFDDIPHLDVHLDVPLPAAGTELRVLGFPFGKNIPQDGDTVTASVFGGVASRTIGRLLQIHAAVYPGNSGSPVLDATGTVLGVVTSVQTLPSGQISEIGYVLPIARVAEVWEPSDPLMMGSGVDAVPAATPAATPTGAKESDDSPHPTAR